MKKYFVLFAALVLTGTIFAQSATPRFSTAKNGDNTGRVLTYNLVSLVDATGADSVVAFPRHYQTYYDVTLLDSFTFKQPTVTQSFYGDRITIIAHAPSGTPKLKFTGSNWISTGTATLGAGLRSVIEFVFDGTKWIETNRVTQ